MNLVRWEPFAELRSLMNRTFEEDGWPLSVWRDIGGALSMPIDMYQTEDNVVVKATIPGVKSEDVDITITGDVLTIKGETKSEEEKQEAHYLRKEMSYGSFNRTLRLPVNLQTDKAEADFKDGVLTVTIPKAEESKPRQIKLEAKGKVKDAR